MALNTENFIEDEGVKFKKNFLKKSAYGGRAAEKQGNFGILGGRAAKK